MDRPLRVHFIHGLESSPQGEKARFFAAHFDAVTPSMDTRDLEGAIENVTFPMPKGLASGNKRPGTGPLG